MIAGFRRHLHAKSATMLASLESRLDFIMIGWLLAASLASLARVLISPSTREVIGPGTIAPYVLLVIAPLASMILALRWFANGDRMPQAQYRTARVGVWHQLTLAQARRHRLYGTTGIMVSLLVGMLINVPVRSVEYLVTMPALAGDVPSWLAVLHALMTLDVVLLSSLYAIAFVAALRKVPMFPRLLVAIWMIDLTMQLLVAQLTAASGLPAAVADPLQALLTGNVQKVLISMGLWLPYLLLSTRVNVTYRHRIAA